MNRNTETPLLIMHSSFDISIENPYLYPVGTRQIPIGKT